MSHCFPNSFAESINTTKNNFRLALTSSQHRGSSCTPQGEGWAPCRRTELCLKGCWISITYKGKPQGWPAPGRAWREGCPEQGCSSRLSAVLRFCSPGRRSDACRMLCSLWPQLASQLSHLELHAHQQT